MSTYNRADLISESVQSVRDQTYDNWELIIADDGSTDNTEEVISKINDQRVKYVAVPHSGFLGKVKNAGIGIARGELIAFHDSDDLWRRDKLEYQIALLEKFPEASFVLSNGDQFGSGATKTPDYEELFVGKLFLPVIEEAKFCFYCPSFIFKREVLDYTGLLDETVPYMRELHLFLRMSLRFIGIFTNERLISIRKHTGNYSKTFLVNAHVYNLKMIEEFHRDGHLTRKQLKDLSADCYYRIGLFYLKTYDGYNAAHNFRKYVSHRPSDYKGWMRLLQSHVNVI